MDKREVGEEGQRKRVKRGIKERMHERGRKENERGQGKRQNGGRE